MPIRNGLLGAAMLLATIAFAADKRDPLPVPDIPGYRTLKCDLHMHTVFSDGNVWPTTRVQEAWRDGLDAISITDHDDYRPHSDDVKKDLTRPFAIAAPFARQLGLILIPGVEITRGTLHFNALFVTEPNAFPGTELLAGLKLAKEQGAVVFWNHPHWRQVRGWPEGVDAAHKQGLFTGMELVNDTVVYHDAYQYLESKNLAVLANSDSHQPIPGERRARPVTLVFSRTADAEGIREALKAHRTAAWFGGEVWGAEEHLKGLWSGAVKALAPELRFEGKQTQAGIQLHNRSAIPFEVKVKSAPAWLTPSAVSLPAESIGGMVVRLGKDAPAAGANVEIELELTNIHTAPGKNLTVKMPVRVARVP